MDDLLTFLYARISERRSSIMRTVTEGQLGHGVNGSELSADLTTRIHELDDDELDVISRMVRDVEAQQQIVTAHRTVVTEKVEGVPSRGLLYACQTCAPPDVVGWNWCLTLRLLALPYADHHRYHDEWRP